MLEVIRMHREAVSRIERDTSGGDFPGRAGWWDDAWQPGTN